MFDIGLLELLIIAVVGLLLIGPERLPATIRNGLRWYHKLRRSFNEIKSNLEREIGTDEIRRQLQNESILKSFEKDKEELKKLDDEIQTGGADLLDSLTNSDNRLPPGQSR